jgi:hypothetical protein
LVWDGFDCLVDLDFDMVIEQASGTAAFLCTGQGTVEFTLEQNGQTVGGSSTVTTCQAPVSTPVDLTLELTSEIEDEIAVCPSTARIEARVLDVDDDPLPDGIVINFVARGAELTSGFAVTIDGFAETTLQVAADAPPEIEVLATATVQGVSLSERLDIDVACGRAFEPSNVNFVLSSNTVECGTSAFLGGRVVDDDGATVGDGTPVMLLATHGTVEPAQTTTTGGLFTVTYMAPATPVVDTVTVAVKGFFESTQIIVPCQGVQPSADGAAPGGALTGSGAGAEGVAGPGGAAGAGGISPPRTGDQGAIRPPNTGSGGLR